VWVKNSGIAGETENVDLDQYRNARTQQVAYEIAATLVRRFYTAHDAAERPWLFPRLAELATRWLNECVTFDDDAFVGLLLPAQHLHGAAEKLFNALLHQDGNRSEVLVPMFRRFDPDGSTADVDFLSRKAVIDATKSHVSHVVLDGIKGNTWEEAVANILEKHPDVHAFVKNDHLGFTVPYVHEGRSHQYWPDFLVRLVDRGDGVDRTLIVEVSGGQKSPGPTQAKADTTRDQWCVAVNNHGGWGVWSYVELDKVETFAGRLDAAIDHLYTLDGAASTAVASA
jgi:type III restriction enzyme